MISNDHLNSYLKYLRDIKHYSQATLDSYRRDIQGYLQYLSEQDVSDITEASIHNVRSYLATRRRQGLTSVSMRRALSSLRGFYKYLIKQRSF